jgi:predicted O-methyltransferase YrrM
MTIVESKAARSAADIHAQFPAALKTMLSTGEACGASRKIGFVGGSTVNNLYALRAIFDELRPRRSLEIGLACGASALLLASLHRERDPVGSGQHTAIDPFQDDLDNAGAHQIELESLESYFRLYRERSDVVLPRLLADGERFQLIYVDGSHHFEDVFVDILYGLRLLDEGGVIVLDDSTWPDVRKAIRFFDRNFRDIVTRLDIGAYRPKETVGIAFRVAQLLGRSQLTAFRRVAEPVRHFSANFSNF